VPAHRASYRAPHCAAF
jgi:hypothetical protein